MAPKKNSSSKKKEVTIDKNGFWSGIKADTTRHSHDDALAKELVKFFKTKNATSVVDFGVGLFLVKVVMGMLTNRRMNMLNQKWFL